MEEMNKLQRGDSCAVLSHLSIYYKWQNTKKSYKKKISSNDQDQHGTKNSSCIRQFLFRIRYSKLFCVYNQKSSEADRQPTNMNIHQQN